MSVNREKEKMESDFDLDIELSLFAAALAIIFILLCITLCYYHIMISMLPQAIINMGFYVRYKVFYGVTWVFMWNR